MTLVERYPLAFLLGEIFIEHFMITTWLSNVLAPRFSKRGTWLLHYSLCSALNLLAALLPVQFAMPVLYIGMAAFTCLLFQERLARKLFAIGLVLVCRFLPEVFLMGIMLCMGLRVEQINADNRMHLMVLAVIYSLFALLLVVTCQLLKKRPYQLPARDFACFALIPACEVFILSALMGYAIATDATALYVLTILAAVLTCLSILLLFRGIRRVAESARLEARSAFLQDQQKQQMGHYEALSAQLREARKQRHDFLNYLGTLEVLMGQGSEKAAACSQALREKVLSGREVSYCADSVVDALLYHKLRHVEEEGIEAEVRLSLEAGGIADIDLICLFSNLLDNAIAGCRTTEGARFLHISDHIAAGFYTLTVSNSKGPQRLAFQEGRPVGKGVEGHGLGTEILQDLAHRYEGECRFHDEGERFTAIVMLRLPEDQAEK